MSALLTIALFCLGDARAQTTPDDAIERAFQKEYAYLVAERVALERRAADLEADAARRVSEAESRLDAAQTRLLSLQSQADAAEDRLASAQRAQASVEEGRGALDGMLEQAGATLSLDPVPESATAAERSVRVGEAFQAAATMLTEVASIRKESGKFFLADGREVEGTIVHLGQVAAFGQSTEGSGALLPAGGGAFQVFAVDDRGAAIALANGQTPAVAGTFLFESADKRADPPREKTFSDLIKAGGTIGLVILVLGAVLAALSVWRLVAILRASGGSPVAAEAVALALRQGRIDEARAAAAKLGGAMGRVLQLLTSDVGRGREELEVVAEQALEREGNALDRFSTALMVGASVAPLLGLLGTVSGMIATFDVITEYGAGNPKLLSGGISEALVTTEFGLVVAIPGVLIGNLLASRAKELLLAAESAAVLTLHHIGRARLHRLPSDPAGDGTSEQRIHA